MNTGADTASDKLSSSRDSDSTTGSPPHTSLTDRDGAIARRYDLQPGTVVLLRPDAHVCARWRRPTRAQVRDAIARACARTSGDTPCP